jgi:hypothetical protein
MTKKRLEAKKSKSRQSDPRLKTIFIDRDGRKWNSVNIQELIDACKNYREFRDILRHYF